MSTNCRRTSRSRRREEVQEGAEDSNRVSFIVVDEEEQEVEDEEQVSSLSWCFVVKRGRMDVVEGVGTCSATTPAPLYLCLKTHHGPW